MVKLDIGINQTLLGLRQTTHALSSTMRQESATRKINSSEQSSGDEKLTNSSGVFRDLQAGKNSLNSVAKNIRAADEAMGKIAENINRMKSTVEGIVKNYPPFPPGSEERLARLKSLTSLRKQIDKMTFPPEEGAKKIMADPALVADAGDWEITGGDNGEYTTIHSREVHTGPTGLNIPDLSLDATDEEIHAAIEDLQSAGDELLLKRSGLAEDALMISRFQENENEIVQRYPSYPQETEAVEAKSEQIMHALSEGSMKGLTGSRSQLAGML
jgi:archaellum component FlaC